MDWIIKKKCAASGSALFDTNILIDQLNAIPQARVEIERYDDRAISIITWMELMVGADPDVAAATRRFLEGFAVVALTNDVAERAVSLRRSHRIKLPDAVVWATAQAEGRPLVTRNTKDFPVDDPGIREPYTLQDPRTARSEVRKRDKPHRFRVGLVECCLVCWLRGQDLNL